MTATPASSRHVPRTTLTATIAVVLLVGGMPVGSATPAPARDQGVQGTQVQGASTTDAGSDASVVELDVDGVDPSALRELPAEQGTVSADPEVSPLLTVEDPLAVLPDASTPEALTERLDTAPFSVMGVTWELTDELDGVIVQYRTYRDGAWSEWGWATPSEDVVEVDGAPATRGATDAIFVPDSTGVQVLVSSTAGSVDGVKIVLVDPGAGPEGTGASASSGTPTDPPPVAPTPEPMTPVPTPDPTTGPPTTDAPPTESPLEGQDGVTPAPDPPGAPEAETTVEETAAHGHGAGEARIELALATDQSATAQPLATASLATAAIARPRIITRAAWGAPGPVCAMDLSSSTLAAAVHHTASSNTYTAAQVPGLLRGIAEYHMRPEAQGGRGWCDIGYNFLVDKFGNIYEGRSGSTDMPVVGVHTGGFNSRTVGVSAIGNYQEAAPSGAMLEAISQVIAWKFAQFRIMANTNVTMVSGGGATKYPAGTAVVFNTVLGHRDVQYTACPGQYLYNALGSIRNRVAALSNQVVVESPQGFWDLLQGGGNSIRVAGWARDPGTSAPVDVQVIVDGTLVRTFSANQNRSDVGAHSYDTKIPVAAGRHAVCLRYVNLGGGADVHLGCRAATATSASPLGVIDEVRAVDQNSIRVRGWARDPETSNPIGVHVYLDGRAVAPSSANLPRPDVQRSAPTEAGPNHGFDVTIPAGAGSHTVCVYGINVGAGSNSLIGCRTIAVVNRAPIGSLDKVADAGSGRASLSGWALDPDTSASIGVHVYVDGVAVKALVAAGDRPDVARVHGLGAAHGYSTELALRAGTHQVCVYGLDTNKGDNPRIGCRSVTVTNKVPVGAFDAAVGGTGEVYLRGWALDPDTDASIGVHVYVDGKATAALVADSSRPDVGRVHGRGDRHGIDAVVPVAAGTRTVCLYAIDAPGGENPRLGCREVVVR